MSTLPSPPDLVAAVRAALPLHLQQLAPPIVAYLEAAAVLRDLVSDPSTSVAVGQALAALRGTEVPLATGLVHFGVGANVGDVTMRDTAGRDVINLTIALPMATPPRAAHGLDDGQLHLLRLLGEFPQPSARIDYNAFAAHAGITVEVLKDELKLLQQGGLLLFEPYLGNTASVGLTPTGRKLLRTLDQGAA